MNNLKSILNNTLARGVTEVINRLGGALFWIMVARYLGATGLGTMAYALSMFSLFSTMSTLGLGSVAIRDIARQRSKAGIYFGQGLKLGMSFSILFAIIMIVVGVLLHPGKTSTFAVSALAIAIFPAAGFYWSKSLLMAVEKMSYIALARSWENAFKVIVGLILVISGAGVRELILVVVFSKIISFAVCFRYASDMVALPVWRHNKPLTRYFLKQIPYFSLINLFNSLFWSLPVILVTVLAGEAQAGIFSAAFKLVEIFVAIALAYGSAFFPVISRFAKKELDDFHALIIKSVKYITILTLAIAGATQILAPHVIHLLYGPGMTQAVPVLQWLIWLIVPFGVIPVMAFTLISKNLQKYDLAANVAGTFVLLITGLFLLPATGAMGMGVSLVIAGFVFLFVELFGMLHNFFKASEVLEWLKPIPGLLLMCGVLFVLRDFQVWIPTFSSALLYVLYLWLSKTITQPEILYLKDSVFVR